MEINFSKMTQDVLSAYGLSEAELARMLSVSQPTIHRIKTGAVKDPSFSTGAAIRELFVNRPEPTEAA